MKDSKSLDIGSLLTAYRTAQLQPKDVIESIYRRIAARGNDAVWIHL